MLLEDHTQTNPGMLLIGCTVNDYLENWIYLQFWDNVTKTLTTLTSLKPRVPGQLPYSDFRIGKLKTIESSRSRQ